MITRYIDNPLLINGLKFDLRIYVAVTSFDPLKIYIYKEGLTRFATEAYSANQIHNRFAYLTNYSVNKRNENFVQNDNILRDDIGNKWSLSALFKHLAKMGVDTQYLMSRVYDIIIKTILSMESSVYEGVKKYGLHRNNCFDLFGFDILID